MGVKIERIHSQPRDVTSRRRYVLLTNYFGVWTLVFSTCSTNCSPTYCWHCLIAIRIRRAVTDMLWNVWDLYNNGRLVALIYNNKWIRFTYFNRYVICWPRRLLPLVSHIEYALRALLRFERRRDRQRDGRTDARPLHYATAKRGQRNKVCKLVQDALAAFWVVQSLFISSSTVNVCSEVQRSNNGSLTSCGRSNHSNHKNAEL